jgi:hypothetical protein
MRSASVSLLYYISESGFGGGPSPKSNLSSPVSSSPSTKSSGKKVYPHLDPNVMGEGGRGRMFDVAQGAIKTTAKSPFGFYSLLGSLGGGSAVDTATLKATGDLAASAPDRFSKDIRAQQEAQYKMTNVDNFYKNLGMSSAIPLLPPDDKTLAGRIISALKSSAR